MRLELRKKSDEELMVLYREGNDVAFEILYGRYSSKVYGYLRNRLSGRDMVDDIFQATFTKLHRSREQYDSSLRFAPWLFTVCKTVMLDYLKREGREKVILGEGGEETGEVVAPETEKGGEVVYLNLQSLPEGQRQAIEMRYIEEFSFEEIAQRLNKSPGNVRQIVSRGIRQLQGMFGQKRGSE